MHSRHFLALALVVGLASPCVQAIPMTILANSKNVYYVLTGRDEDEPIRASLYMNANDFRAARADTRLGSEGNLYIERSPSFRPIDFAIGKRNKLLVLGRGGSGEHLLRVYSREGEDFHLHSLHPFVGALRGQESAGHMIATDKFVYVVVHNKDIIEVQKYSRNAVNTHQQIDLVASARFRAVDAGFAEFSHVHQPAIGPQFNSLHILIGAPNLRFQRRIFHVGSAGQDLDLELDQENFFSLDAVITNGRETYGFSQDESKGMILFRETSPNRVVAEAPLKGGRITQTEKGEILGYGFNATTSLPTFIHEFGGPAQFNSLKIADGIVNPCDASAEVYD